MLRFAVFDEQRPAGQWPLVAAHLLGPEDLGVPGQVTFDAGHIVCRKRGAQATALCLQHDTGEMGALMLQTCLLPDRDRPYILTVELARHRIKTFIAKSEEWQMFDLGSDHPAMERWERARAEFTKAITSADPREADRAARSALVDAIDATEKLALAHAEILLGRRFGQRAGSSTTLGVRVWPTTPAVRDEVGREFDLVSIPLRWSQLEVEEGAYGWEPVDRWMQWAQSAGKPVLAGPLLDFARGAVPPWMYVWQHDYDTCRDLVYDHIEKVVHRYRASVGMWNLAAGLNVNDNFRFTLEQMIDLVRMTSLLVKQTRRNARMMIEVVQPFGESVGGHRDALPAITFLERVQQAGIRLSAIGVRLLVGGTGPGLITRDLMQLSSVLDRFFFLETPVLVSAAGAPSRPGDARGGSWRGPWSEQLQARWASEIFAVAMSKPFVESVFWGDLVDHAGAEVPDAGLIGADGRPKPALGQLVGLRKRLRKPLGSAAFLPQTT